MDDLRARFGRLLASHRHSAHLTQAELAERAQLSIDTIQKLETGGVGPSFKSISRLAEVLDIDPAELFTDQVGKNTRRKELTDLTARLAALSEAELVWARELLVVALRYRRLVQ